MKWYETLTSLGMKMPLYVMIADLEVVALVMVVNPPHHTNQSPSLVMLAIVHQVMVDDDGLGRKHRVLLIVLYSID